MKTKSLIIAAAAFGLIGYASAKEPKKDRPHRVIPAEGIKKFDKDGDGKLNEEERQAAKAARKEMMKARKAEMLEKFDKDGDGELNEEEKKAMREAMKARMLEKFDKDGDGELNEEEKAEMRKEMMDRPGKPQRRGGKADRRKPGFEGDKEAPSVLGN